jgi:quaternary ammonium compound-resistance protein SugE
MKWIILIVAGIFEIGWAVGLKHTDGFSRFWPSAGTIAAMIISLGLLGIAMKSFPLGTAYAIWVGVGVVGTTLLGIILLGESASAAKLACVALIVVGVIGLKAVGEA